MGALEAVFSTEMLNAAANCSRMAVEGAISVNIHTELRGPQFNFKRCAESLRAIAQCPLVADAVRSVN